MAERKITYSLDFQADTKNVQSQLDRLKNSLNDLASQNFIDNKIPKTMQEASIAAMKMQGHLKTALDPLTGKLDLSRLSISMKNSGDSVKSLGQQFLAAGNLGKKAFLETANAIANAQKPMIRTNKLMNNLWVSLKNTAKWQISSAVIGGFTNSLSSAVSFAKDLNKSLNDIRIVSGDSAEQMEKFAKQANQTAKTLGTTTTDITKGALIYRQQGDTAAEAAQKAEITAKAAAITTESTAEEMSEYLTGIWNSYQVGSDQLELFVDKLAYVGATTATSMEEIATSMTKVAATANTVGVEYEQLLGIIATVSSATRISAEQVGTAYKTILARMGDLKLEGSIDEEGITVTLGDVSSTLKQVGIDVLDANKDLRDMGVVIEEVGNGWNNFTKAEKAAIAEALAGKRQYTQLFALFENWNEYEKSVKGAAEAQGTLNEQHKIYLESWDAASKNVKASIEGLTMSFFNDEAIIDTINAFADLIKIIDATVDGLGGFTPILATTGAILTRVFSTQIGGALTNMTMNLMSFFGMSQKVAQTQRTEWETLVKSMVNSTGNGFNLMEKAEADYLVSVMEFQTKYENVYKNLNNYQRMYIENQLKEIQNEKELIDLQNRKKISSAQTAHNSEIEDLTGRLSASIISSNKYKLDNGKKLLNRSQIEGILTGDKLDLTKSFALAPGMKTGQEDQIKSVKLLKQAYSEVNSELDITQTNFQELGRVLASSSLSTKDIEYIISKLGKTFVKDDKELKEFINSFMKIRGVMEDGGQATDKVRKKFENLSNVIDQMKNKPISKTEVISQTASLMMSLTSSIYSVVNAFKVLSDDSATTTEKIMSLGMTIPMVLFSFSQISGTLKTLAPNMIAYIAGIEAETLAHMVNIGAMTAEEAAAKKNIFIKDLETKSVSQLTAAYLKHVAVAAMANPLTWVAIGAAAIVGVTDLLTTSTAEAAKKMQKEKEELDKLQSSVSEVNSALEEKQKLLKEVSDLSSEKYNSEKIKQYTQEINLLEKRKELLDAKGSRQKEKVSKDAKEVILSRHMGIGGSLEEYAAYAGGIFNEDFTLRNTTYATSMIVEHLNTLKSYTESKSYEKINEALDNLDLENPEDLALYEKTLGQISDLEGYISLLESYEEAIKDFEYNPEKKGTRQEQYEAYLNNIGEKIQKEKADEKATKAAAEAEKKKANVIKSTMEVLKNYDGKFDAINSVLDDFNEEGKVSYDTLTEIQEAFGNSEEVNEFITNLSRGNLTLKEAQEAMSILLDKQIQQDIEQNKFVDKSPEVIEAYLKEKGVINASEVALSIYNATQAKTQMTTEHLRLTLVENQTEMSTMSQWFGISEAACYELYLEELRLGNLKLDFSGNITALKNLGNQMLKDIAIGSSLSNTLVMLNAINPETLYYTDKSGKLRRNTKNEFYDKNMGLLKQMAKDLNVTGKTGSWTTTDGQTYTNLYEAVFQEALRQGVSEIDPNMFDIKIPDVPPGGGDEKETSNDEDKPETPESVDWISILLRDVAYRNIGYIEDTIKVHEEELDLLDEEKGQIDEIIAKQNELLFLNRLKQEGYKNQIAEQNSLLDRTISQLTPQFDRDTVLSWFDSEGEQSDVFGDLLESQGMNIEAREYFEEAWDKYKLIIDAIKEANEGLRETQLEEPTLVDDIYNSEIKKIDLELERLEDINKSLEDSAYMDYEYLRKNYGIMQDFYKKEYEKAKATGREADARKYLALWWEKEAEIVKSVSDEYDDIRSNYDLIAEELKRREEEAIELLDQRIQRLQYTNTLTQTYNTTLNNLRATQHEVDKELRNSMLSEKYLSEIEKEKIFNAKDYLIITEEIAQINEEIEENYIKYQEKIEDLENDELYRAELLTKEFEAQAAEKQRALEILKMELDLTKKRNALTEALEEKNVRIFQGGQWMQVANFNAVQAAANELAETEYQIAEKKRQNAQEEEKTDLELRIAELEERKAAHEAEIKEIEELTQALEDAKTKWETGFDATATSAKDLADAFNDAMETLEDEFGSSYSKVRKDTTSGLKITNSFSPPSPSITLPKPVSVNKGTTTYKYTGNKATAGPLRTYASGTNDTTAGPAKVNENGLELYATNSGQFIELNPHGKIFNNEQFNYLYALSRGKTSIDANGKMGAITIGQMTLALPHVTDVQSFTEGLKHLNEYIRNTINF